MILRLLVSVVLLWLAWLAINAVDAGWSRDLKLLALFCVALPLGYHRDLRPQGVPPHWWRISIPRTERVIARNSIWGVPLGRGRTIRVSVAVRNLSERAPSAVWIAELFPSLLVKPVRRLLTRFGKKR